MAEISEKVIEMLDNAKFDFGAEDGERVEVTIQDSSITFTIGEAGEQQYSSRFSLTVDQLEALAEIIRIRG